MKIGIDFDNTIAKYDKLFVNVALSEGFIDAELSGYDKVALRDYLRKQPDGETSWMKLQGLVYGQYMSDAELMPSFVRFLMKCNARSYQVFVVSHKTEFGHFDTNNVSLRTEAMKWMTNKRFFDVEYLNLKRSNVFFANNRDDKVAKITELRCDYFIDDLPEVFANDGFPPNTRKIIFSNSGKVAAEHHGDYVDDWQGIDDYIFGCTSLVDITTWFTAITNLNINKADEMPRGGNSNLYKINASDNNCYAAKVYPDRSDNRESRLRKEYRAIEFLQANNVTNIPTTVIRDEVLGLGIYSWVNGEIIEKSDLDDIKQAVDFIQKLYDISKSSNAKYIGYATEACLSANDLVNQVEKRIDNLMSVTIEYDVLKHFLVQQFIPLWQDLVEHALGGWPSASKDDELRVEYQTLSPSDFGFHNAIRQSDNLVFLDFEYFGWDDPVKLTADFMWHPAMNLDVEDSLYWEKSMIDIFSSDPDFEQRLHASKPFYGMRWGLIVLNRFLPDFIANNKLSVTNHDSSEEYVLDGQLEKAKNYCNAVMEDFPQVVSR